jgi:hypothetical protein
MPHRPIAVAFALTLVLDTSVATERAARAMPPPPLLRHAGGAAPAADSVVGFRLRDQFGRVHDAADYRGRVLILVGAGRGGRAAGTAWVDALRGLQPDSAATAAIPVVAVADLRGVPRLLRRVVRGRFPDDPRRAVLLDWDGALARRLDFHAERCTIVLVGPDGRPGAWTSPAAVDTSAARELLRQAAELAPAAPGGSPQ